MEPVRNSCIEELHHPDVTGDRFRRKTTEVPAKTPVETERESFVHVVLAAEANNDLE